VEDTEALIRRMEERLQALDSATRQRDEALRFLEQQVNAAQGAISGGQEAEAALREGAAALSTRLDDAARAREQLSTDLNSGQTTIESLSRQLAALNAELGNLRAEQSQAQAVLETARQDADSKSGAVQQLTSQVASLQTELEALRGARQAAEQKAAELERHRSEAEAKASTNAADVSRLVEEVAGLRDELARARERLGSEQATGKQQQTQIAALSEQLKEALESRIEELSRYRSEFFGRLREALGDRADMRIVGDRFVFQSEVLFASGSAELGPEGQTQLRELATSLKEVADQIPPDVNWILRVDGHTDRVPIRGAPFRNNWELSVERALAVVEFLVAQGIPADRLAATGFGEFQPLDAANDEIAYRRNRRIEFKLTER
jgi:chemotaxis protein MotB